MPLDEIISCCDHPVRLHALARPDGRWCARCRRMCPVESGHANVRVETAEIPMVTDDRNQDWE
jgi:hypothetical protein